MPDLDFDVVSAEPMMFAAVPTLQFKLVVRNGAHAEQVRSVMLRTQVRIQAPQRAYDAEEKAQLRDLFGEPGQWGATVKSLFWSHIAVNVPPFADRVEFDLPLACTYDFEVVASKYLAALKDGDVPLLFLFSGTVLYSTEIAALQVAQIPWEKEAAFRMPVRIWQETMDRYFPNSAWLRIRRDQFDRLSAYKARQALLTWEAALDRLLDGAENGSLCDDRR